MTRTPIAFSVGDISALAKSLRKQFEGRSALPSHVEVLNMLARSTGHRKFQQLRAATVQQSPDTAAALPLSPLPVPAGPDLALVARAQRHFDARGRLIRWPARRNHQLLCLWALWAAFPTRQTLGDAGVKAFLAERHTFGDHALLRRELVDCRLITRNAEGSVYRRIEREPPPDARALIRRVSALEMAT
ncbi:hypothetical protein SAMN02745157_4739 [Kaistia soli DSM 19436]|uniref:DUF2087 domain-containing protein n=1 Tax=Kaistia soli DSM 19436 TaxID=1122133 RepID=A0A1M5MB21_9HYPH|nr:DUF2087 domain-containing protein [Kaistia soli]SHG74507.1 hypothetical protein SAMN02745157_4739 [Kaistia soli DSM 19436]